MALTTRRKFLALSLRAGGAMALAAVTGCALLPDPELKVATLAELESESYLVREFNRRRILIRRMGEEMVIFSLVCSHKRCTVKWVARDEVFACPCHEGLYDERGEVISGPPPKPLRRFVTELRGEEIWVINQTL